MEAEVNEKIFEDISVECMEIPLEDAKKMGAKALFGEKYGDTVRVVSARSCACDYSIEFCGGTHVDATSQICLIKIISEGGIAAGTRRIEAVTGRRALAYYKEKEQLLTETAEILKANKNDVSKKASQLMGELKESTKEINELKNKMRSGSLDDILKNAIEVNGVKLLTAQVDGQDTATLREISDVLRDKLGENAALLLLSVHEDKVNIVAAASKSAVNSGVNSGNVVREVAKLLGGGGGGRPDSAQAGGKDTTKTKEALELAQSVITGMIK